MVLHHSVYAVERATLPLEAVPAPVPAEKPSTAPKSVKAPAKPPPAQVVKLEAIGQEKMGLLNVFDQLFDLQKESNVAS